MSNAERRGKKTGPVTKPELDEAALRYLDRFDASVATLRRTLRRYVDRERGRQRDVSGAPEIIDELIARYTESGILSDERFAQTLATGLRRRGTSRLAIVHKLRSRGVDGEVAKLAVSGADTDTGAGGDAELDAARALVRRRRLGPFRPESERKEKHQRDLGVLARAGFSLDVARRALGADGWEESDPD